MKLTSKPFNLGGLPQANRIRNRPIKFMKVLLLLFIVMPITEMLVLIKVGSAIGALPTIALVLLTAMIGVALLKRQGPLTLLRAQERMRSGQLPATEMVEGVFLAIGGALLLTPGFITDAIGFLCLLPGSRHIIAHWVISNVQVGGQAFTAQAHSYSQHTPHNPPEASPQSKNTIEGEFRREDEK